MGLSANFPKESLISIGTVLGKLTKTGNFRLTIHCLDLISKIAKSKVIVKASSEMNFLYGHHLPKAGISKIVNAETRYDGVIVFDSSENPIGFGIIAHDPATFESLEPTANLILNFADIGEYLRSEDSLS